MIRRRRATREIPFSFDSFLDIVANVLGIIIRLILVVWVGARSYSSLQPDAIKSAEQATPITEADAPPITDPMQEEIAAQRRELARAQDRLLAQLREMQAVEELEVEKKARLDELTVLSSQLMRNDQEAADAVANLDRQVRNTEPQLDEIRRRSAKLLEQIRELEKQPPPKQVLRYRTPVSQPLQSEELFFECSHGRVCFIDVPGMLIDARDAVMDKRDELKKQWQVQGYSRQVGPYRLKYTIERERGTLESITQSNTPDSQSSFSYGLSAWQVEPLQFDRGETLTQALSPQSQFRQIVDTLDPTFTAITFWVTPDSFALYRQLRDFLFDRDIVVAGRPLPEGMPIASSRRGTASRGQ